MCSQRNLPSIIVSCMESNELVFALGFARDGAGTALLTKELRRAAFCHPHDLPQDAVALNSRVIFHFDDELGIRSRFLVHPADFRNPKTEVSALSPVGAALLGLRPGDVMPFFDGCERRNLSVDAVALRPMKTDTDSEERRGVGFLPPSAKPSVKQSLKPSAQPSPQPARTQARRRLLRE